MRAKRGEAKLRGRVVRRVLGLGEAQCAVPWRIRAGVVPGLSRVVPGCPACVKTREIDFDCSPGEQLKPIFRVLTQTSLIREFRNRAGVVPGLSRGCPVVVPGLSCESYVSPVNPVNPVNTVNPL